MCRGQSLLTGDYPDLFAVLQYTYGGSGGNFLVPDMQGLFPRGLDTGSIDPGRTIGDIQDDENKAHTHTATDNGHTHPGTQRGSLQSDFGAGNATSDNSVNTGVGYANITIGSSGTESRPKNMALNYIIRT